MAKLNPIERTSLTTSLLDRYNKSPSIANVGGGSAKDAGSARTDFISSGDKDFQTKVQVASDASSNALSNFNKNQTDSNVPTTKYKG